jgi:integrase
VISGDRAVGTLIRYEQVLRKQIVPVFGRVAVSRLATGDIARMLAKQSPSVAKTCRSVLRSVLDAAVIDGVATWNTAAQLPRISRPRESIRRASGLTGGQVGELLRVLRSDVLACEAELPDELAFIAGTGARTGEALALAWQDVDLGAGTVTVTATVNAKGERQVRPKTSAGHRELSVPGLVLDVLWQRSYRRDWVDTGEHPSLVFPSELMGKGATRERDTPRWVSNFTGQVRTTVDRLINENALGAEFAGVSSRWLRKAVALSLDAAGMSPRQLADQLGHSRPSVSLDIYTPRMGHGPTEAAQILNLDAAAASPTEAGAPDLPLPARRLRWVAGEPRQPKT